MHIRKKYSVFIVLLPVTGRWSLIAGNSLSTTHSVLHLPSAGGGSLPGGVSETFIPKGSGPLAVLPDLDCCGFPLTCILAFGNN